MIVVIGVAANFVAAAMGCLPADIAHRAVWANLTSARFLTRALDGPGKER